VTGIEVYKMYLSLKLHFTSKSFDYFKYGNSAKASPSSFDKRKDKFFFVKLSRTFNEVELRDFFVSNMVVEDKVYPATLVREGAKNYAEYMRKMESLSYIFRDDVGKLYDLCDNFDDLFKIKGVHPVLVKAYLGSIITLETITIFEKIFGFMDHIDIDDKIVWEPLKNRVRKYEPFLNVDPGKYKKIIQREYL